MRYEYECALSGLVAPGGVESDTDGLGDLPIGWTKITVQRRRVNPAWMMIQQVKEAMVENVRKQMAPDIWATQGMAVAVQVEAQLHGLENDTPMFVTDVEDVVYLSDSDAIEDSVNELREELGLAPLPPMLEEGEDDDDMLEEDEEGEDEEEEEDDGDESHLPHDEESGDR